MLRSPGKLSHHVQSISNSIKIEQKILKCSISTVPSDSQREKLNKYLSQSLQCNKSWNRCGSFGVLSSGTLLKNQRLNLTSQSVRHLSDLPTTLEPLIPRYQGMLKILVDSPPIEYIQNHLIILHSNLGLPWWATIVLLTCTAKALVTAPSALYQQYILAKSANLKWEMDEIAHDLKREANFRVQVLGFTENESRALYAKDFKEKWNELIVRENCHPMKGFVLILTQLPLWICLSCAIRNLCLMLPYATPVAQTTFMELSNEGIAWFPNLAAADPYYILPITMGLCNLMCIEFNYMMRVKEPTRIQKMSLNFFRGISLLLVPIASVVPSGMSLYWATSSVFGLLQNIVIVSPRVRRFFRIEETQNDFEHPYKHLLNTMRSRIPRRSTETSESLKKSPTSFEKK